MRNDIPYAYCLEAQRTECVRAMPTPDQYTSRLRENQTAAQSGSACIIGGRVRNDLSPQDCEEAKATGGMCTAIFSARRPRRYAHRPSAHFLRHRSLRPFRIALSLAPRWSAAGSGSLAPSPKVHASFGPKLRLKYRFSFVRDMPSRP